MQVFYAYSHSSGKFRKAREKILKSLEKETDFAHYTFPREHRSDSESWYSPHLCLFPRNFLFKGSFHTNSQKKDSRIFYLRINFSSSKKGFILCFDSFFKWKYNSGILHTIFNFIQISKQELEYWSFSLSLGNISSIGSQSSKPERVLIGYWLLDILSAESTWYGSGTLAIFSEGKENWNF